MDNRNLEIIQREEDPNDWILEMQRADTSMDAIEILTTLMFVGIFVGGFTLTILVIQEILR